MSFRIQRGLEWIGKALGIDRASASDESPATILDTIQPELDILGWDADDIQTFTATAVGNGVLKSVTGPDVPAGEQWYMIAADLNVTTGAAKDRRLDLFSRRTGLGVTVIRTNSVAGNTFQALERPLLLFPGMLLSGESFQVIAIGENFVMRGMYLRMPRGEYIHGSPWG